jgi:hypothetical protein
MNRSDAHGLPNKRKMPSIYKRFCTRPGAPIDRRGSWFFCRTARLAGEILFREQRRQQAVAGNIADAEALGRRAAGRRCEAPVRRGFPPGCRFTACAALGNTRRSVTRVASDKASENPWDLARLERATPLAAAAGTS